MKKTTIDKIIRQFGLAGFAVSSLFLGNVMASETSSAQFLKLGAGARAAAMADAFSSVSDDVTAAYWNPAGLAQMKETQISMMQNSSLLDTQYQYFGGAMPLKNQTVAFSIYRMDYGTIDRYTAGDEKDGSFDAGSLAGSFSVGRKVNEKLSLGMNLKFIQESIESEKASTFGGDLGVLLQQGQTNFSFVLQHLGAGLTFVDEKGSLPQTIRAGVSRNLLDKTLLAAFEISKPNDNDATLHGGVEYSVNPLLMLRGGYQMTPGNTLDVAGLTGVTAGLGVNFSKFSIDYGFVPFGDLGSTHRISFLIKFNQN